MGKGRLENKSDTKIFSRERCRKGFSIVKQKGHKESKDEEKVQETESICSILDHRGSESQRLNF